MQSTSTTTTAPPHRRRCLAPAACRRRLAQRVAASPARRPTPQQPRRLPSHTARTPHHRAPPHPDWPPRINVPTKTTQLFLQPLDLATSMLRRGPPPPRSSRPRARKWPQPLELPRDPRPHNPPFEPLNGELSLRPLKPPCRQVPKTYASLTTCAPINPFSRPRKHHTCPHVPSQSRSASAGRTDDDDVATSSKLVRCSGGPVRFLP